MKITVVGASGLIGARVVEILRDRGHEVVPASRSTGVDVLAGTGLDDALAGADALIDVTNSPSSDVEAVMDFFTTSTTNLIAAAQRAGVGHYVALSIVGVDGVPDSGYFRAKLAQERLITGSELPWTIVRATQFAEFADEIVDSMTEGGAVRVPDALIQPIAADDVAEALAQAATDQPRNGRLEVGGPARITFEQLARDVLARRGRSAARVVVDPAARYFGARLQANSLVIAD